MYSENCSVHSKGEVSWWTRDTWQAPHEHNRRYTSFSQQSSHDNFISNKKAMVQARKVILNAKHNSFCQFVSTINRTTPLSSHMYVKPSPYSITEMQFNPINSLTINGNTIDGLKTRHNCPPLPAWPPMTFLLQKGTAEYTVPNFAMGGVNWVFVRWTLWCLEIL